MKEDIERYKDFTVEKNGELFTENAFSILQKIEENSTYYQIVDVKEETSEIIQFLKENNRIILYTTNSELKETVEKQNRSVIFGYQVADPTAYGVVEFDSTGKVLGIEEKPANPKSNYAVPGLYFYTKEVVDIAADVKPSARGEIEITSINNEYLNRDQLSVELLGRGMAWLDTGTYDGLLEASNFIATIQKRQGLYVSCLEEIAYNNGWITKEKVLEMAAGYKTDYGRYLKFIAER